MNDCTSERKKNDTKRTLKKSIGRKKLTVKDNTLKGKTKRLTLVNETHQRKL